MPLIISYDMSSKEKTALLEERHGQNAVMKLDKMKKDGGVKRQMWVLTWWFPMMTMTEQ